MSWQSKSPAIRNYNRRFFISMGAYLVLLFGVVWLFKHQHPAGLLAYVLALLPAMPLVAVIVVVGLYLAEEKDEFQRNLLVLEMLWALGATLAVTTVWGFLEDFTDTPHLQPYLIFPMFWFFVGVLTPLLKRRYQ